MFILTKEQILQIHDAMIKEYGGDYEVRDQNLFESSCESPYQTFFGMDLYPTLFEKAAKYMHSFAHYQSFYDGNKRTGFAVMAIFLKNNGYQLDCDHDVLYQYAMKIATDNTLEIRDIANFLESHAHSILNRDEIEEDREEDFSF